MKGEKSKKLRSGNKKKRDEERRSYEVARRGKITEIIKSTKGI